MKIIPFEEAVEKFQDNNAIILLKDQEYPLKFYTKEYKCMLDDLSFNQNDFEIFANLMYSRVREKEILNTHMHNAEFIKTLKEISEECQEYLSKICIHKNWEKEKIKFCKNIDHLMNIIKKVDLGITIEKTELSGKKVALPQNFFTIKKMKLNTPKSFFQKLFSSEKGVPYRMINKITAYN